MPIFQVGDSLFVDAAGEGIFRDRCVAPDGGEEFVLGEQLSGVAEKDEEDAEGLGLDGQGLAGLGERELTLADFHIGESKNPGTDGTFSEHEAS